MLESEILKLGCYNPLYASVVPGVRTVNGKPFYHIYQTKRIFDREHGRNYLSGYGYDDYVRARKNGVDLVPIPCGKCLGCRLTYARQWADRCMLEKEYHADSWFVTFTYNDDHVPKTYYGDPATGEAQPALTLRRKDIQDFLKRLRKAHSGLDIRYFGCAEYGPQTWRPHYHMILYGLPLNDLVIKRQDVDGKVNAYTSETLSRAWSLRPFGNYSPILDSIGDVECSEVTWAACNYVARYIVKKQLGPDGRSFYETFNLVPPFTMMSTRPAIGRRYYDEHPAIYDTDKIHLKTPDGGRSVRPPRYFDKLYDIDHPNELQEIKDIRRRVAQAAQDFKLHKTSLSIYDLEALEERRLETKMPKEFDL